MSSMPPATPHLPGITPSAPKAPTVPKAPGGKSGNPQCAKAAAELGRKNGRTMSLSEINRTLATCRALNRHGQMAEQHTRQAGEAEDDITRAHHEQQARFHAAQRTAVEGRLANAAKGKGTIGKGARHERALELVKARKAKQAEAEKSPARPGVGADLGAPATAPLATKPSDRVTAQRTTDRTVEGRVQRVQDKIAGKVGRAIDHPEDTANKRALDRIRGMDAVARDAGRAVQESRPGYFGKFAAKRAEREAAVPKAEAEAPKAPDPTGWSSERGKGGVGDRTVAPTSVVSDWQRMTAKQGRMENPRGNKWQRIARIKQRAAMLQLGSQEGDFADVIGREHPYSAAEKQATTPQAKRDLILRRQMAVGHAIAKINRAVNPKAGQAPYRLPKFGREDPDNPLPMYPPKVREDLGSQAHAAPTDEPRDGLSDAARSVLAKLAPSSVKQLPGPKTEPAVEQPGVHHVGLEPKPGTIAHRAKTMTPDQRALEILARRAQRAGLSFAELKEFPVYSKPSKGWIYQGRFDRAKYGQARNTIRTVTSTIIREAQESRRYHEAEDAEQAKYPQLSWGKSEPGYLRMIPGESGMAKFFYEAKEVGYIEQAHGHHVPVYEHKGKLVRVRESPGNPKPVHEINLAEVGSSFHWKQRKDVVDIAKRYGAEVRLKKRPDVNDLEYGPAELAKPRHPGYTITNPTPTQAVVAKAAAQVAATKPDRIHDYASTLTERIRGKHDDVSPTSLKPYELAGELTRATHQSADKPGMKRGTGLALAGRLATRDPAARALRAEYMIRLHQGLANAPYNYSEEVWKRRMTPARQAKLLSVIDRGHPGEAPVYDPPSDWRSPVALAYDHPPEPAPTKTQAIVAKAAEQAKPSGPAFRHVKSMPVKLASQGYGIAKDVKRSETKRVETGAPGGSALKSNSRVYLGGNTFAHKETIKSMGRATWDKEAKQWQVDMPSTMRERGGSNEQLRQLERKGVRIYQDRTITTIVKKIIGRLTPGKRK